MENLTVVLFALKGNYSIFTVSLKHLLNTYLPTKQVNYWAVVGAF